MCEQLWRDYEISWSHPPVVQAPALTSVLGSDHNILQHVASRILVFTMTHYLGLHFSKSQTNETKFPLIFVVCGSL